MGIDRYTKDDEGFRKYLELIESTPSAKRKAFLDSAKVENPKFAEAAEKYLLTFERILALPDLELTEVFGSRELKAAELAVGIASVEDVGIQEKIVKMVPRELSAAVLRLLKEDPNPKPYAVGIARLKIIQASRSLEKRGKLKSVQVPRFGAGYFKKKGI